MATKREWLEPLHPEQATRTEIAFEDGKIRSRTVQPIRPVLDVNARLRQHQQYGTAVGGARCVANVPVVVFNGWKREWEEKWSDTITWDHFRNWQLEKRENSGFRVHESRGDTGKAARLLGLK